MQDAQILFRPGQLADLPQVREISKTVWDGHDYVPYVWEEWLNEPTIRVFVLEKDEQLAAFYCLMVHSGQVEKAGWLRGLRVGANFRKQGLAGQIVAHAIAQSQAQGFDVLRYATNDDNTPMHLLAERLHFRLVGLYSYLAAPALPVAAALDESAAVMRSLKLAEVDNAWNFIQTCPSWRKGEGLHSIRWNWYKLERLDLQSQVEQQLVWGYFEKEQLRALAIGYVEADDAGLFTSWLDGELSALTKLAQYLQFKASLWSGSGASQEQPLTMLLLADAQRDHSLQSLGFEYDVGERIYELSL